MSTINGIVFLLLLLTHSVTCEVTSSDNETTNKWYNDSLKHCQEALNSLVDMTTLEKMLNDVYYIDSSNDIYLEGDVTFEYLSVDTLKTPDVKSHNKSHAQTFDFKYESISHSLNWIEREVKNLKDVLGNAMKTDGTQEISGNITFNNAYFNCGPSGCNIKSIETSTLNGRNIVDLSKNVYRLNRDEELIDHINFTDLIVDDIELSYINGVSPEDIVTKSGDFTFEGDVTFAGPVTVNRLKVNKTVNGREINRKTVLTTTGDQLITSTVRFTHDIVVKDLNVEHLPQIGPDVDNYLSSIVQIDRDQVITGTKTFNQLILDNLSVEGGVINDFNLTSLQDHLLTRDSPQTIEAHVDVGELVVHGDIDVDRINGNRLEEIVVRRNVPTIIRGDKLFTGPVYVESMSVEGTLNGRQVNDRSLGLMLKTGSQVITGRKNFRDIEVNNVSVFHGNVGPLNVELLESKMGRSISGGKRRTLSGAIHLEDVQVNGYVNGIELSSLMRDFLMVNQTSIPNVNLNISKANFKQPIRCDTMNGLKFPDDYLTTNTEQFIGGNTHISSNIVADSALNLTRINGFEVDAILWDSLASTRDQTISGTKTIRGNLFVKNLNVASLNNIDMNDIVLLNGSGIVLGNKTFSSISVAGLSSVNSIRGVKSINRISVDELFSNSITKRTYQSISPNIHVKRLVIPLGTNVNVTELGGMKLNDILSSVVYLRSNSTQIVRGRKKFTSQVSFGNLEFTSTFAGYTKREFETKFLSKSPSEITANISLKSDLFIDKELIVMGHINELNINSLSRHLPINRKPLLIKRPMSFRHVRVIGGNVEAQTINGLKFAHEMVTKKYPITLLGSASFPHGMTVDHLTVGSINGVKIEGSTCSPLRNVFDHPYSLTITGNAITASIRSERVNDLTFNHQTTNPIRGFKRFKKLNIKGPIHLRGLLNNKDVKYLQRNYLSRTKDQPIDSEVILRNATFSGPVIIGGNLLGRDVFTNGFDITKVAARSLRSSGNQNIEGTFYFPGRVIFKRGLINSNFLDLDGKKVDLTRDTLQKNRPNEVRSKITFERVDTDDLKTHERSNLHRDLNNLNSITQFYGWKNFSSLDVDDLIVDEINGVPFGSLLRSDADANISGTVAFKNDLVVKPNLTVYGTVNGIKLQVLGSKLVLVGQNNTITAPITLRAKPTVRSLQVPGPWKRDVRESLSDLSIPEKMKSIKRKLLWQEATLKSLDAHTKRHRYGSRKRSKGQKGVASN